MLKRDRGGVRSAVGIVTLSVIFVLSCLTAWDFASSYTRHAVQAEIHASSEADTTEQEIARSCPAPATTECIARVVKASREQQRSEADLNAQRDMAKWAFAMVIVSALGTGIVLLGLLFISQTLLETRKGNKINRRIGEAQVRAYLSVSGGSYTFVEGGNCTAGLVITNQGNSPAKDVNVRWALIAGIRRIGGGNLAFLNPDRIEVDLGASIANRIPTSTPTTTAINFRAETVRHARSLDILEHIGLGKGISFVCEVGWTDVFDRKQTEQFFLVSGIGEGHHEDVGPEEHPHSIYIYNGTLRLNGNAEQKE
jgi:hypothetical protein